MTYPEAVATALKSGLLGLRIAAIKYGRAVEHHEQAVAATKLAEFDPGAGAIERANLDGMMQIENDALNSAFVAIEKADAFLAGVHDVTANLCGATFTESY